MGVSLPALSRQQSQGGTDLDVCPGDEPRPVGHDLVELVEVPQLLGDVLQPLEPALVSALKQELIGLDVDQVGALVPGRRL